MCESENTSEKYYEIAVERGVEIVGPKEELFRSGEKCGDEVVVEKYAGYTIENKADGIKIVRFNRPDKLNALTQATKRDLIETLLAFQMDESVKVVVFAGVGKGFVAGDDLSDIGEVPHTVPSIGRGHDSTLGTYNGLRVYSQELNRVVRDMDKITIAAINGYAIQTGLSLALCCDFRLASDEARLGSATLRYGLLPDEGGHWLLIQLLGLARAMEFVFRKQIVNADEALELGLIHEVVGGEELEERVYQLALEMAKGPQLAMRMLKRSMYLAAESSFEQALEDIAVRTAITDHHSDASVGVAAFKEKKDPTFGS